MNEFEYFAIVYEKKELIDDKILFIPSRIIPGFLSGGKKHFLEYKNNNIVNTHSCIINIDKETQKRNSAVANLVTIQELKELYPDLDLSVAANKYYESKMKDLIVTIKNNDKFTNSIIELGKIDKLIKGLKTSSAIMDSIGDHIYEKEFVQDILNTDNLKDIKEYVKFLIDYIQINVDNIIKSKRIAILNDEELINWVESKADYIAGVRDDLLSETNIDELKDDLEFFLNDLIDDTILLRNDIARTNKEKSEISKERLPFEQLKPVKLNPMKMFKEITSSVIGQDKAVKDFIISLAKGISGPNMIEQSRCLLYGPTGSGKTQIINEACQYLGKKVMIVDSTQITRQGYVGRSIEDCLSRLVQLCNNDMQLAENSVIVFDEIDKLATKDKGDVAGRDVLYSLQKFMENNEYDIKVGGKPMSFNTANLLVYGLGAFSELFDKNIKRNKMGFGATMQLENEFENEITVEDFVKIADMPAELMGRFSKLIRLNEMTIELLGKVLLESNRSALLKNKEYYKDRYNIDVTWEESFITEVAKLAKKRGTNARALGSVISDIVDNAEWEIITNKGKYSNLHLLEKRYILR